MRQAIHVEADGTVSAVAAEQIKGVPVYRGRQLITCENGYYRLLSGKFLW